MRRNLTRLAGLLAGFAVAALLVGAALAVFTDTLSLGANAFSSDTLDPPSALGATGGASIDLTWTATPDTYAAGHRVYRAAVSGGPYAQIAELTPRTTVTYNDAPAAGTYYYVVRAYYQSWESANSNESAATTP